MARQLRLQGEGCFYHIISRGDDRKSIYKTESDYLKFLEYILKAKDRFNFYLHCYCLMTNHYHLLVETNEANLSKIMQFLNTSYTIYYNIKHGRSGHLFQGRFKSILIDQDSYYDQLVGYIHTNPVTAKMVTDPSKYRWSSYGSYIYGSSAYVDLGRVRECLGHDLKRHKDFVKDPSNCEDPSKEIRAGFLLGDENFIDDKLSRLSEMTKIKDFAYKRVLIVRVSPEKIINSVSAHYGMNIDELIKSVKRPMTAKKAAIYLLQTKAGLTNIEIGNMFNMHASAISKAANNFEKEMLGDKRLANVVREIVSTFEV